MLTFLTGFCLGLAIGWFSYIKHTSLVRLFFLYSGPALTVFYLSVVLPTAKASDAMDMGLLEFVIYGLDTLLGDFWLAALSWITLGVILARFITEIGYGSYVPGEDVLETREDARRRVRANMKYSDDYFD